MSLDALLEVPPLRAERLRLVLDRLSRARSVVLTTHVQADGDGAGSQAAVAAWLEARGARVAIVNPTPFPEMFRFLLPRPELVVDLAGGGGEERVREADLVLVLDTSEPQRIGDLARMVSEERTLVVDHHPAGGVTVGEMAVQDATAAATGELIFDILTLAGGPWPESAVQGMYVALVSDTGSFRYGNTSPRVHAIAAELMRRGVDPEEIYRRLFATAPRRRLDLLREALGRLHGDPEIGLGWMIVEHATGASLGATPEDFDGLIEHVRSIEGTQVAILFRGTDAGETKISLRSNGDVDVNRIARQFGGGGHVKAAGALVPGAPGEVAERVVDAARAALLQRRNG